MFELLFDPNMDITTVKESDQSLFDELMNSSGELDTAGGSSSPERRRVALHRQDVVVDHPFALNIPKAFSSSIAGGRLRLSDQVAAYNQRRTKQFHIRLREDVSAVVVFVVHILWVVVCAQTADRQ